MNTGYYRSGPQHMMHQNHHNPYGHQQQQQHPPSSSGSSGPGIVGPDAASMEKKRETRRRTKTGCLTCRKRRIKCDEGKPECMRCIKSKRVCEGYSVKTVFRNENQMHYQQNIRPTPNAPSSSTNGYSSNHQPIQFSVPQYQATNGDSGYNNHHTFATPQYGGPSSYPPSTQGNNKLTVEHASRNSSASNASGVSANSEQRRISVLSLMSSSEKFGSGPLASEPPAPKPSPPFQAPPRTAETDARDNYYYNYYVSCHAYTLARCIPTHNAPEPTSPDHPSILWPQIVPSLINNDPAGCRPLFDAAIAYTAHIRFEEIPIDFTIQSAGSQSRLIELGLKAYIDIIRGTSVTLSQVETFFTGDDYMRQIFRWGLLQHTIVQILADAKPRVPWVNYLGTKAFGSNAFQAHSDVETFYLGALRHISTGSLQIPQPLLDLHSHYDFLASPGMDVVYFAFVGDYDALRNLAYHITAHPRLEFLHLVWGMLNGARLKLGSGNEATRQQAHDLEMTANEVMMVLRQTS